MSSLSSRTTNWNWWNTSLAEVGVRAMDRGLAPDAGWNEVLRSGREDLTLARLVSGMACGPGRRILDVGCGVGRLSFPLTEHFGEVVGIDISAVLIERARSHNQLPNLSFDVVHGSPLLPDIDQCFDTVFANEVFYYLDFATLTAYSHDAFRLLRAGGEYVFQLNLEPITWKTRLSWSARTILYNCSVKTWRDSTTSPGFIRRYHPRNSVKEMLETVGFENVRITVERSVRQTWFLAQKAASMGPLKK